VPLEHQDCFECPAKISKGGFNCHSKDHHYRNHPRKFYAKLKELNKIRLEKK
jgi:hypothetical protein